MSVKAAEAAQSNTWPEESRGDLTALLAGIDRTVDVKDWPFARRCEHNILIYESRDILSVIEDSSRHRVIQSEWINALMRGPGVIVVKGMIDREDILDEATSIFERLIDEERMQDSGGGDHFARPGANNRVWNAAQKHCLADPANFAAYFGNQIINLVCEAWLGKGYQLTAQVNRVNPGGAAQSAHRDYHLGFMLPEQAAQYPSHIHQLSPFLTLQGAIAHTDMPVESGPTCFLPFSQTHPTGYVDFPTPRFQQLFDQRHVQLPLGKGDAVFFNPAVMHAAGANRTQELFRMANLLQISSPFGRAMEAVDRTAMVLALYPVLLKGQQTGSLSEAQPSCIINASAEGYSFPTNLDNDPPINGLAPQTQNQLIQQALSEGWPAEQFAKEIKALEQRRIA